MAPDDFSEILKLSHQRGIYVIADECYAYLNYTGRDFSAGSVPEAREHVVITGSLFLVGEAIHRLPLGLNSASQKNVELTLQ